MSDEILTMPAMAAPPTPAERRAFVRYRCERPALGRAFITNSFKTLAATVLDVSRQGMALAVGCQLDRGTQLTVEMEGQATTCFEILVEVINTQRQADGSWRCGCRLVWPMSEEELHLLRK